MLNEVIIRNLYDKIQNRLYNMIPEKWDKVYLYASIIEQVNNLQTGEMFFYYYPAGLIKKNPINVYEIPEKFGIDDAKYNKLVENLYEAIKELRIEYEKAGEKLWSNITISVIGFKFNIEFHYEDLLGSKYSSYDRHLIWQYKYLHFPLEKFAKKERKMITTYLSEEEAFVSKSVMTVDNFQIPKRKRKEKPNRIDNYEEYKKRQKELEQKQTKQQINQQTKQQTEKQIKQTKNQILNFKI